MGKKHTIFICACKHNSIQKKYGIEYGIDTELFDYQLGKILLRKIENEDNSVFLKDPTEPRTEQDARNLAESRVLVVLCTERNYLDKSQNLIDEFIKEANIGTSDKVKKVIYVSVEGYGTLSRKDFSLSSNGNYLVESFELTEDNLDSFVDGIHQYFQRLFLTKKTASVRQILQEYRSLLTDSTSDHPITREWLDNILDKWIANPGRNKILWLQGEHGSGKTIYIGTFYQRLKNGKNREGYSI